MGKHALGKGDKVSRSSHGHEVDGTLVEEITEETDAAGRHVVASEDEPQFRVVSQKSGKDAVHKPEVLHRKA